jgi:acetoacetyl-[acyl-carrier protein] synthase
MDDALAMELGATIYGAGTEVFVNADGHKKSIAGPGVGNYITMAKAVAAARAVVGAKGLRSGGLVQAHGTGTPQNRVTESEIFDRVAQAFGINNWPVAALKSYLGHSLGSASGDQITATLGSWAYGLIPGINTIDGLAGDVKAEHLAFSRDHRQIDPEEQTYAIINAKGFGGNNATATMLSPATVNRMLKARYSRSEWSAWERANEAVRAAQEAYDDEMIAGDMAPVYKFDHGVLGDSDVVLNEHEVVVDGRAVNLDLESPFDDMRVD